MSYEIGTLIGDYEIVNVCGTGGMGKVYKVRNTISDRIEAMKILLPNLDADQELAQRFLREIKVQASLQHPNIASLRTAQRVNNQLLMIMEYVEGATIEQVMRDRRIPLQDCVRYATQVLSALDYAHAHGIVHRDIKPPNIMLTPEGVIKLMDFGIAKISVDHRLTQTGKTVGSLFYMSPEQIRGTEVDGRSDVYSFGIMLYEMVTGRRPFEGESDYSIMAAHLQQAPQPPMYFDASLPQVLNDVILMSIAKDPAQRFQTADAFRLALDSMGKGIGVAPSVGGGGTQVFMRPAAFPAPPSPPSGPRRTPTVVESPGSQPPTAGMVLPATAPLQLPSLPQMQSLPQPPPAPFQPQPQPQFPPQFQQAAYMAPQGQTARGNRGLYMVLGSVVTIGILAAAAFYVPKLLRAHASGEPAQTQSQPPAQSAVPPVQAPVQASPTQQAPTQQAPTQPEPAQPAPVQPAPVQQVPPPEAAPRRPVATPQPIHRQPAYTPPVQQTPPPVQQTPPPVTVQTPPPVEPIPQPNQGNPPGNPSNARPEELSRRMDVLRARMERVNGGVARLEEQQRRMGSRSGDLVASQHRMMYFMETADAALRKNNVEQARTALNNAQRELEKLEERVGR